MMKRKLLFSVLALVVTGSIVSVTSMQFGKIEKYTPRKIESKRYAEGISGAMEYMHSLRADRKTNQIDPQAVLSASKEVDLMKKRKAGNLGLSWIERGPDNIGGRTRAILVKRNNPSFMMAGGISGGLWKSESAGSSWVKVDYSGGYDFEDVDFTNTSVSCIVEAANGDIYFGTGEGLALNGAQGEANGGTSFVGYGMWKSTDGGETFTHLSSTTPSSINSGSTEWAYVNRLGADPADENRIYAATNRGLRVSYDGGETWETPVAKGTSMKLIQSSPDVKVATDGSVFAVVGNSIYYSANGDIDTFEKLVDENLPVSGVRRIELAIAPSDPNYIYACIADDDGNLKGVFRSTDKGDTWTVIGEQGASEFQLFGPNGQGWYDNVIAVYPNNKDKIIVGGIDMWSWDASTEYWEQKTNWTFNDPGVYKSPYYIHADQHIYVFHPTNPDIIYAGSDGGISRSVDGGETWITLNKNFNVTQFYTLAAGYYGEVMGGTQDNGTLLLDRSLNSETQARYVYPGDGSGCDMSMINPLVFFASSPDGAFGRTVDYGENFSSRGNETFKDTATVAKYEGAFVAPILIWESINDTSSRDSVSFVNEADTTLLAGTEVTVYGYNNYPIAYTLTDSIPVGDSIQIQDVVTARFYAGLNNTVWMTKGALDFSRVPEWYKIANIEGETQSMAYSQDGNHLFVGTVGGKVYRISNLLYANDKTSANIDSAATVLEVDLLEDFGSFRAVTSISVHPNDANKVVVTLGNYGNSEYIYYSDDALAATPSFAAKQGDIPAMPVYASCMLMDEENVVVIGTEMGVFTTSDISAANVDWSFDSEGVGNAPVFSIFQQTFKRPGFETKEGDKYPASNNYGMLYIGTHGRGIWEANNYLGINDQEVADNEATYVPQVKLFPNPVVDKAQVEYNIFNASNVSVQVYNLNGSLLEDIDLGYRTTGRYQFDLNCVNYQPGTYIVSVKTDTDRKVVKMSVIK